LPAPVIHHEGHEEHEEKEGLESEIRGCCPDLPGADPRLSMLWEAFVFFVSFVVQLRKPGVKRA
jgi:hypothetical protein